MTVTWILESNVFAETCFDRMVAHLQGNSIPHHIIRVIPFLHEIEGKVPDVTTNVTSARSSMLSTQCWRRLIPET
jgi:hypothetical protein